MDRTSTRAPWGALVLALLAGACSFAPPDLERAERGRDRSSQVLAADGSVLATLEATEAREDVPLDELPDHLPDAVVAVEDARFWQHRGVDLRALGRAAVRNAGEGRVVEGGSTITQQYVKNAMLDPERTVGRKVEEALLALRLERAYSKERILELYLNTIYFGNGAYGVEAAAREYFGVGARELDLPQSATLAGVIRSPDAADPLDEPELATRRRNRVLARMVELGRLPRRHARAARATPLVVRPRPTQARYGAPHLVERAKRFVLEDARFGETLEERRDLLFTGGLRITTTVDPPTQARAEAALGSVRPAPPGPDGALVAVEPRTGFVRALVGGRDFFGPEPTAQLDLAAGGPGRPAGSAFKPFVLAAALTEGIPLTRRYPAPPRLVLDLDGERWEVDNHEGGGGGEADLLQATVASYNTVYAQLVRDVGPADAVATATRLGVRSPLAPVHSAVLGTNLVTPLDMAAAYATLANRGVRVAPTFVTRVETVDGEVLFAHEHRQERALDRGVADRVTVALEQVVAAGTGVQAQIGRPAAGKTGTGQEYRDAWFVGYTPELATAVWMGFPEEGRRSMVPPATPLRVGGGTWPALAWQRFTAAVLAGTPPSDFEDPPPEPLDSRARVPDVSGDPAGAAQRRLVQAGFRVRWRDVPAAGRVPGTAVGTDPPAGTPLGAGTVVVLEVAVTALDRNDPGGGGEDAAPVEVPDVLGQEPAAARRTLEVTGLRVRVTEAAPPGPPPPPGVVWRQQPAAGARVPPGTPIELTVGPPAPPPPPTTAPPPLPDDPGPGRRSGSPAPTSARVRRPPG